MRRLTGWLAAVALLVGACGADPEADPDPSPEPSSSRESQPGLTQRDLRAALVRAGDVPADLGTGFERFSLDADALPSSRDLVSGPLECGDYLDGELGPSALQEVESAHGDPSTSITVSSRAEYFGSGDADEVMDTIRDLVETCDRFTMEQDGAEVEVDAYLGELADMAGYEDVGDDGALVGLLLIVDGVPFRGLATSYLRVGDVIATVRIEVPADLGRDPSTELVALTVERLRALDQGD